HAQILAVKSPHFRNTQSGVDSHAIQSAWRDFDFDTQVRRRIFIDVELELVPHPWFVLNPIAFVRFQALFQKLVLECRRATRMDRYVQLQGHRFNKSTEQCLAVLMTMGGGHDFQPSTVIRNAEMTSL